MKLHKIYFCIILKKMNMNHTILCGCNRIASYIVVWLAVPIIKHMKLLPIMLLLLLNINFFCGTPTFILEKPFIPLFFLSVYNGLWFLFGSNSYLHQVDSILFWSLTEILFRVTFFFCGRHVNFSLKKTRSIPVQIIDLDL